MCRDQDRSKVIFGKFRVYFPWEKAAAPIEMKQLENYHT